MNAVSVVPAPLTISCPDWCRDAGSQRHRHGGDLATDESGGIFSPHSGPTWGTFIAGGTANIETGALEVDVRAEWLDLDRLGKATSISADTLRQLAADALAAAEWLEVNQ